MTQRKFKPETRGGYWVRNVEAIEADGVYVLQAEIGNDSSEPPSNNPLDWNWETFTKYGEYIENDISSFDLIEVTQ